MAMSFRGSGSSGDRLYRTASLPNTNSAYTMMAWARVEVDRNDFSVIWAFTGSNWDNTNSYEYLGTNGDGLSLHVDAHPDMDSWTGDPLVLNEWHHLALVRETVSGPIKVYVDGTLVGTFTASNATSRETVQRLDIAGFGSQNYSPFHGSVAYARIWTVALTGTEVATEMGSVLAVKAAGLYGDYPLSGGIGVRHQDVSGNGRHLTELGSPTDVDPPVLDSSVYLAGAAEISLAGSLVLTRPVAVAGAAQLDLSGTLSLSPIRYLGGAAELALDGVATLSATRYLRAYSLLEIDGAIALLGGTDVLDKDDFTALYLQRSRRRRQHSRRR